MKRTFLILSFIGLISCNSNNNVAEEPVMVETVDGSESENVSLSREILFKQFLRKFKVVSLPYMFRESYDYSMELNDLEKLNKNSYDTLFAKADFFEETYCYGMLPDTTKFYSLIFIHPASVHYPVLATYSKAGELLSQESLIVGGFGSDCGLVECSMTAIINKDHSILSVDSMNYAYYCDSTENPIPNSGELILISKKGRIQKDGVISIGKESRTEIKINP